MTLQEEIAADWESGELADLMSDVEWNGNALTAMVDQVATAEGFGEDGPMLEAERRFKFLRADLVAIKPALKMLNDRITYGGRVYDVTQLHDRPGSAVVVVQASLRP